MKAIIAVIVIGVVEVVALVNHIDGVILASCLVILGGVAGYEAKNILPKLFKRK